jgi:hypothetical protein
VFSVLTSYKPCPMLCESQTETTGWRSPRTQNLEGVICSLLLLWVELCDWWINAALWSKWMPTKLGFGGLSVSLHVSVFINGFPFSSWYLDNLVIYLLQQAVDGRVSCSVRWIIHNRKQLFNIILIVFGARMSKYIWLNVKSPLKFRCSLLF